MSWISTSISRSHGGWRATKITGGGSWRRRCPLLDEDLLRFQMEISVKEEGDASSLKSRKEVTTSPISISDN
ncbi:hypothetical protein ACOSP7_003445 [Xanthoceras sorbifolium]